VNTLEEKTNSKEKTKGSRKVFAGVSQGNSVTIHYLTFIITLTATRVNQQPISNDLTRKKRQNSKELHTDGFKSGNSFNNAWYLLGCRKVIQ